MLRNELFGKSGLRLFAYISLLYFASSELYATVTCSAKLNSASENERYELFASHPGGWTIPSGKYKYEYKLYDHHNNKDMWKFTLHNYPPKKLYVNDDGWVVIWNWQEELTFISIDGTETGQTENLGWSSDKDRKYVTVFSTGGSLWASFSYSYFHNWLAKSYFVIRTWWDKHLVFELQNGIQVQPDFLLLTSIESAEKDFVLSTLREYTKLKKQQENTQKTESKQENIKSTVANDPTVKNIPYRLKNFLYIAIYMAGRMGIKEAIPLLRDIEDEFSWNMFGHGYKISKQRQNIQLTLRRLGEKPKPFPSTMIYTYERKEGGTHRTQDDFTSSTRDRSHNVSKLKEGMSIKEVLSLIGYPDFASLTKKGWGSWYYDIDDIEPYSLCLMWNSKTKDDADSSLEIIRIIKPAMWINSNLRDKAIVY